MARIILVDDYAIIRDGIRSLLAAEKDLQVVGQASNGHEMLALLAHTPADVVVLDSTMSEMDGEQTTHRLQTDYPAVNVLVMSMLGQEEYVLRMLHVGAKGYVLKNAAREEIVYAVRTVAAGRPFLCTEIGLQALHKPRAAVARAIEGPAKSPGDLSRRETEVLKLIADGMTTPEIAAKLFTSKRTIETHRQNIIGKTQAKNTASLVRYAMQQGLLT